MKSLAWPQLVNMVYVSTTYPLTKSHNLTQVEWMVNRPTRGLCVFFHNVFGRQEAWGKCNGPEQPITAQKGVFRPTDAGQAIRAGSPCGWGRGSWLEP